MSYNNQGNFASVIQNINRELQQKGRHLNMCYDITVLCYFTVRQCDYIVYMKGLEMKMFAKIT